MKYYICIYKWRGRYGACGEKTVIVKAETEKIALDICLSKRMNTEKDKWSIKELNLDDREVLEVCENNFS